MASDEIDAVVGRASVLAIKVGGSGKTPAHVGQLADITLAEAPHRVTKFSIPLGPVDGEVADLVGSNVPGLRHQDDAVQHWVLRHCVEERARGLEGAVALAPEYRSEVEAEAINVHHLCPVA